MKILVVEDSRIASRLLEELLKQQGHDVTLAPDGVVAWQLLQKQTFDLVLSDWMMPHMDGIELLKLVREKTEGPYCYFILLTARDQREDKLMGLQAGADDFLVKPPDPAELVARLEVARRILQMQEKLRAQSTQLQDMMQYLELSNMRFSELYMSLPVACVTCDLEGRIQEWNHQSEQLFGMRGEQVVQQYLWDTLYPKEQEPKLREKLMALKSGSYITEEVWTYSHPDSEVRHLVCYSLPLRGVGNAVVGAIMAYVDITSRVRLEQELSKQLALSQELNVELEKQRRELARANQKLAELATLDPLTNLPNRRLFWERANEYFSHAKRSQHPLSLILFDVDHFKRYNDTHGHTSGDEILKELGKILKQLIRVEDVIARYGGEEFALLLPSTNLQGAKVVAERIRNHIENHPWPLCKVTVSLGVASLDPSIKSAQELLDAADVALYQAKQQGRNRVVAYEPNRQKPKEEAA